MSGVFSPRDDIVTGRNADDEEVEINATTDRELATKSRSDQMNEIINQNNTIIKLLEELNS